jgi:ferredoxin
MEEQVYRKLAQRLDALPNGFPATQSGVELRLLAKIFTPEEAYLAAELRLIPESASEIALRLGKDSDETYKLLKSMVRKGLIRAERGEDGLSFGSLPFVVGLYEEQLPRMDEGLATLFEQYYVEVRGKLIEITPAFHRVIPVEKAIPFNLDIFPYERASQMLDSAQSWGVRDCICRVQQQLVGKGCGHPINNCLAFAPVEGLFQNNSVTRAITREEAFRLLRDAEESGLVHTTGNYQDGNHYICNCCTCCCGILRGVAEFDIPVAVARSEFRTIVDSQVCNGCEECVSRCQFGALSVPEGVCVVNEARCLGCGICSSACSPGALILERRPKAEIIKAPANIGEWMAERANRREIPLW